MPSWERLQQQQQQREPHRQRSTSPDASSVFDNSITENSHDTTQDTAITEPDVVLASTMRASSRPMTREEARQVSTRPNLPRWPIETCSSLLQESVAALMLRDSADERPPVASTSQKAQILRLRLGLANYKVRTGQMDVPLERLQMRPVQGQGQGSTLSAASRPTSARPEASLSSQSSQESLREGVDAAAVAMEKEEERVGKALAPGVTATATAALTIAPRLPLGSLSPEKNALPRSTSAANTPQNRRLQNEDDEQRLNSSALRGGAANGLLSLARGA